MVTYEESLREWAVHVGDTELRRLGLSNHRLLRIRALPSDVQTRAIERFFTERMLEGLRRTR